MAGLLRRVAGAALRQAGAARQLSAAPRAAVQHCVAPRSVQASPVRLLSSTSVLRSKADLLEALTNEIEDEEQNAEAPDFPPTLGDFAVSKHTIGDPETEFTATFDGDKVKVQVNLNDCQMLDANEVFEMSGGENPDDEQTPEPQPFFVIEVTNTKGKMCSFWCMLDTEAAMTILKVSMSQAGQSAVDQAYHSDCSLWDDGLVEAMHAFLATKGITEDFVRGLHDYVFNKEYAEYTALLYQLRDFTQDTA
mmetsp:Transcript_24292/g.63382  ORF Transcript_24292/g.63382 Transcript_24292/m.63382 type:complete len:250 (-) Transcript_24292:89-838(-)|eukprot:CAMPEP_0182927914 /NCGR_PEP_ID=MMETSP0105_2-20130417/14658_1 /TAXON_ID=81532 ORGANISM="Acanthoeca-like sp., Strain 10tr" /NCGR_SAMPLE_ID=MMETSP0105_2 /ASSEMBLY_ACC=CAM_ASM_000205 /LENGTH=249 /DNA_ID=CAMNT_0025065893 /DNA_START=7 /DNA_END=756 /DNA_ORIENTATION=+